jgi:isopentenyldiphosphate isomerase
MSKSVKQSVSIAVFNDAGQVLIVQRPPDDEDLPDAWGLPASSLCPGETWADAVYRTGRDKLGVELHTGRELNRGKLERRSYNLEMRLHEAEIVGGTVAVPQDVAGITQYQRWKWGCAQDLRPAAERGSLCCRLFLAARP